MTAKGALTAARKIHPDTGNKTGQYLTLPAERLRRERYMGDGGRKTEPRFQGEVSEQRHLNMSRIRGKDTSIEVRLRKALWAKGYRYRKNYKKLPGSPDIALTKYRIAVFCDSEFFHGKDWDLLRPRLEQGKNPGYWVRKIERNMERDQEKDKQLRFADWTVIHFWGKEILKDTEECIKIIEDAIFDRETALYYNNYNI